MKNLNIQRFLYAMAFVGMVTTILSEGRGKVLILGVVTAIVAILLIICNAFLLAIRLATQNRHAKR